MAADSRYLQHLAHKAISLLEQQKRALECGQLDPVASPFGTLPLDFAALLAALPQLSTVVRLDTTATVAPKPHSVPPSMAGAIANNKVPQQAVPLPPVAPMARPILSTAPQTQLDATTAVAIPSQAAAPPPLNPVAPIASRVPQTAFPPAVAAIPAQEPAPSMLVPPVPTVVWKNPTVPPCAANVAAAGAVSTPEPPAGLNSTVAAAAGAAEAVAPSFHLSAPAVPATTVPKVAIAVPQPPPPRRSTGGAAGDAAVSAAAAPAGFSLQQEGLRLVKVMLKHRTASLFKNPVTDSEAPGYSRKIKEPMDLKKLKAMLDAGEVVSAAQLTRLVKRMTDNCILFNGAGSEYAGYAGDLWSHMQPLLEEVARREAGEPPAAEPTPDAVALAAAAAAAAMGPIAALAARRGRPSMLAAAAASSSAAAPLPSSPRGGASGSGAPDSPSVTAASTEGAVGAAAVGRKRKRDPSALGGSATAGDAGADPVSAAAGGGGEAAETDVPVAAAPLAKRLSVVGGGGGGDDDGASVAESVPSAAGGGGGSSKRSHSRGRK